MKGSTHLSTWVSTETKQRFGAFAAHLGLSESALLKRLVELNLQGTRVVEMSTTGPAPETPSRDSRVYLRLRPEDHLLLSERATGRGMAAATYASFLLRAHLRAVTPIPDRELAELKRSVAALGMIGRNLNQIARVANQTERVNGPSVGDLRQLLRACEVLRDHVKGLIRANTDSWETGYAEAHR
jgi:Bacterial mobilisation protein (MobC)